MDDEKLSDLGGRIGGAVTKRGFKEALAGMAEDARRRSDGLARCPVCSDGSCMLCDDNGYVPAEVTK